MENDVIFSDEMDHSGVFLLPPFLPVAEFLGLRLAELLGIGDVADGGIKPYVEHFALSTLYGHGDTPVEVTGDGTGFESAIEPTLTLAIDVGTPFLMVIEDPVLEPGLVLIQREIPVFGLLLGEGIAGLGIIGVDQFIGREGSTAFLTLVAIGAQGMAARTLTADIAVGQEMTRLGIIELLGGLFNKLAGIIHLAEIVGRKLMMDRRGSTGIDIEGDTELLKGAFDKRVIAVHHFLGRDSFFAGAYGYGHTVLIATADKHRLLAFEAQIARVDIRRNIDAGKVSDMDRTIRIRQGCCD